MSPIARTVAIVFLCIPALTHALQDTQPSIRRGPKKSLDAVELDGRGNVHSSLAQMASGAQLNSSLAEKATSAKVSAVGDALRRAKAEILALIDQQQKAKKDTQNHKNVQGNEKKRLHVELKSVSKAWKIWYWELWSDKQKTIEAAMAACDASTKRATALISSQDAEIKRLEDARDSKHDAAGVADDLEKSVVTLASQIDQTEKDTASTKTANDATEAGSKKESDNMVKAFDDAIANLTKQIDTAQAEVDSLASYTPETLAESEIAQVGKSLLERYGNPLVDKLQTAKARLNAIIAAYQAAIDGLSASIAKNIKVTEDIQADKDKVVGNYDAALQQLANEKTRLENEKAAAVEHKRKTQRELAAVTEEGEAAIETLLNTLSQSIADLTAQRAQAESDKTAQIAANAATAKAFADAKTRMENSRASAKAQGEAGVQAYTDSVAELTASLEAAQAELNHLRNSDTGDKVSDDDEFPDDIASDPKAGLKGGDSKSTTSEEGGDSESTTSDDGGDKVSDDDEFPDDIASDPNAGLKGSDSKSTTSEEGGDSESTTRDDGASLLDVSAESKRRNHPLAEKLGNAKKLLRGVITEWKNKVQRLEALLWKNKQDIADMKTWKKDAIAQYDAALQTLVNEKARLANDKTGAQLNKTLAEQDLDIAKAQGEAEIQNLEDILSKSIVGFKAEIAHYGRDKTQQIATNAATEKSFADALAQLEIRRAAAETQGANGVQSLTEWITKFSSWITATQAGLDDLKSSDAGSFLQMHESLDGKDHPLAERIRLAKEQLNGVINDYTAQITNLDSLLAANKLVTDTTNVDEQKAIDNYDAWLKGLADEKMHLETHLATNQDNKAAIESDLAKTIVDSEQKIAKLLTDLRNSVSNLQGQRRRAEQDQTQQIASNAAIMKGLTDSHTSAINYLQAQIDELKADKKDAQDRLDTLKQQHGV